MTGGWYKIKTLIDDINQRIQNHPQTIVLRSGEKFFSMLELQSELKTKNFNMYLKLPNAGIYETPNTWDKIDLTLPGVNGGHRVDLNNITYSDELKPRFINPYLTWHGSSGRLQVSAYELKEPYLKKPLILQSPARSINDLGASIQVLATIILPLNEESHTPIVAPPKDFGGNYIEVSTNPYLPNRLTLKENFYFVIDKDAVKNGFLLLDVILHSTDLQDIRTDGIYPIGTQLSWVTDPLTLSEENESNWRITLFAYQNIEPSVLEPVPSPIRFLGRSENPDEQIVVGGTYLKSRYDLLGF